MSKQKATRKTLRERAIWRHFSRRFRQAYRSPCPFEGSSTPWPPRTRFHLLCSALPSAFANRAALRSVRALSSSDREIRERIDRMFASASHRAAGIDLARVANWWAWLAGDEQFAARTRAVVRSTGNRADRARGAA